MLGAERKERFCMKNENHRRRSKFDLNDTFPRVLLFLRKQRGYSQKKAADDLGISQSLLSHYERGVRECGLNFVVRVADYYGVSCDYLLGRMPQGAMPVLVERSKIAN